MPKRLTEYPARLQVSVTESGANTYTESSIELPVAVLARGRVQAVEVLAVKDYPSIPDVEDDQNNLLGWQWVRDTQSALLNLPNDQIIHRAGVSNENDFTTSGSSTTQLITPIEHNYTYDGVGQIVMEQNIHFGVAGTGNGSAKTVRSELFYHLVELAPEEVTVNLFLQNS